MAFQPYQSGCTISLILKDQFYHYQSGQCYQSYRYQKFLSFRLYKAEQKSTHTNFHFRAFTVVKVFLMMQEANPSFFHPLIIRLKLSVKLT